MLSTGRLEDLNDRLYRAYDLLDSYEALNLDKIAEFEEPKQLYDTLCDLDEALQALKDAREIVLELMGRED